VRNTSATSAEREANELHREAATAALSGVLRAAVVLAETADAPGEDVDLLLYLAHRASVREVALRSAA
jgi:hypothetical protein